jgi:hypothetical protein
MSAAISWLLSIQDPTTGAWTGSGPTATPNANSTGVITQALRAAGEVASANRGAEWIRTQLQLTTANATGTPAEADVGAVAYDPAARTLALADGITSSTGDQWRRSTTQAVLALGLERYGATNDLPLPTTTTTTTVPTTTLPTTTGPTTTAPPSTTSAPTTSAPTTTTASSTGPPAGVDSLTDSRSGAGTGSAAGRLAVTGDDTGPLAQGGALLVAAGVVLLAASTRRRRP